MITYYHEHKAFYHEEIMNTKLITHFTFLKNLWFKKYAFYNLGKAFDMKTFLQNLHVYIYIQYILKIQLSKILIQILFFAKIQVSWHTVQPKPS